MGDYIGIYWTRAVPWAGFHGVSGDADKAAVQSRTIRYQRDLVRRYVKDVGGSLVRELVLTDPAPDRASKESVSALKLLVPKTPVNVIFVYVDFGAVNGWRKHPYLLQALEDRRAESLWPEPLMIDGKSFDPVHHFRGWRDQDKAHQAAKDDHAKLVIETLAPHVDLSWPAKAEVLNQAGRKTHGGKPWTADNLRKFIKGLKED